MIEGIGGNPFYEASLHASQIEKLNLTRNGVKLWEVGDDVDGERGGRGKVTPFKILHI